MHYPDRKPEDMQPLKFKVGDKIMGFNIHLTGETLVGGTIVEALQSTSFLSENSYKVALLELPESYLRQDGFWFIDEREVMPFDEQRWQQALKHWKRYLQLRRAAYQEYARVRPALRGDEVAAVSETQG